MLTLHFINFNIFSRLCLGTLPAIYSDIGGTVAYLLSALLIAGELMAFGGSPTPKPSLSTQAATDDTSEVHIPQHVEAHF
jgi:hypothetical protein